MQTYAKFEELPIISIKPGGWLRRYLERQRDGLTGHLEAAGAPFDRAGWGLPKADLNYESSVSADWWPYEQTGYWIDGMIRCGYLLNDPFLINKARQSIDHVLNHPDSDGYLGPLFLKEPIGWNHWAHAVFFRAITAYYSATGDPKVLSALTHHYLSGTSPHSEMREVCNVETILWTYGKTGAPRLLEHAAQAYDEFNRRFPQSDATLKNMLSGRKSTGHGVTFNEMAKLGAIFYLYTGRETFLQATVNAYRKLDRDQMLIDGVCSSSENLRGKDPLDSHETCDIADYSWSAGYLLMATGSAEYADKIEKACFNAAPGAVKSDFKALQYFSCPNQVVADRTSNHSRFHRGNKWMSYRPNPGTECCPGAVNRIIPNYVTRMWLSDGNGGLVASLYGPSTVTVPVGSERQEVTIIEETAYPFSEEIDFLVKTQQPVEFSLTLRIPGWCTKAGLHLNGELMKTPLNPGTFVKINRTYTDNDRLTLTFPMDLQLSHWPRGGIGIERGPLVYALCIEEDWRIDEEDPRGTREFPAWNLYPASPWNYALALNEKNLEKEVEIIKHPVSLEPWSIENAPVELRVPARRVKGWRMKRVKIIDSYRDELKKMQAVKLKGEFLFTPQLPNPKTIKKRLGKRVERVTLVPYGCTNLRVTIFPQGSGD